MSNIMSYPNTTESLVSKPARGLSKDLAHTFALVRTYRCNLVEPRRMCGMGHQRFFLIGGMILWMLSSFHFDRYGEHTLPLLAPMLS